VGEVEEEEAEEGLKAWIYRGGGAGGKAAWLGAGGFLGSRAEEVNEERTALRQGPCEGLVSVWLRDGMAWSRSG